jgi:hypothetical protein
MMLPDQRFAAHRSVESVRLKPPSFLNHCPDLKIEATMIRAIENISGLVEMATTPYIIHGQSFSAGRG